MGSSRRRIIALGLIGALSGCLTGGDDADDEAIGVEDDSASDGIDSADSADTANVDDHNATQALLEFDEDVANDHRSRAIRALGRTLDIVDGELAGEVYVAFETHEIAEVISPPEQSDGSDPSGPDPYGHVLLRDEPALTRFPFEARYSAESRQVTISLPSDRQAALDAIEAYFPTDVPEDAFVAFPSDPIWAHEFTHAVQFDTIDQGGSTDSTVDSRNAWVTIEEGTADYVAARVRSRCIDGTDEACDLLGFQMTPEAIPPFFLPVSIPYVNGTVFAHFVLESGGWEQLWNYHRDPPETAWAGMFPEQYLESGIDLRSPTVEKPDSEWAVVRELQFGVNPIFELLVNLGVISTSPADGNLPGAVTETIVHEYMFRTDLLAGWRGDQLFTYERAGDEAVGYQWVIAMDSKADATALERAFQEGYENRGSEGAVGWKLEEVVVAIESSGPDVELWMATSDAALADLRSV